jgi:hypothetical protein
VDTLTKEKVANYFRKPGFLQSARNQEEPVEVDSDEVISTKV